MQLTSPPGRAVAFRDAVAPAVRRGMGQDAVGAMAAHRIAAPARRLPGSAAAHRRHALVLIGVVVLVAAFAGAYVGRLLASL